MAPPVVVGTRASEDSACRHSQFGGGDDPGHGGHGLHRVLADAGLGGQHDGVRPLEHGVGHVGHLGPGRPGRADHGLEHLRGHDDRLGLVPGQQDGAFLDDRHLLERELDPRSPRATISPSKASSTSGSAWTACGFSILAMSGRRTPDSSMIGPDRRGVVRSLDEGQRDQVRAKLQRPAQVRRVLAAERGDAEPGAGHVEALVVGDRAADQDPGPYPLTLGGDHLEHHAAVVDQDLLARPDVGGQARVGGRGLGASPGTSSPVMVNSAPTVS